MKAPEFEGPADPIEADNWLTDIQVILDFMGLSEQEKVLWASFVLTKDARHWWMTVQMRRNVTTMSWQDFVTEFRAMYYNREILAAQQDEFNNFREGSMTVIDTNHANNMTKPDTKSGYGNPRSFKFDENRDPLLSEARTLVW
ncbi:hypothetical protein TIFTF001_021112 [Ficus carica]|uniref:Retrotransposon gag domain-containing protein n=1 Tax=Ficus carica TaxID=3494 RepID=A0AA88A9X1_FICCA|nr:hypothetical protein TIFTF001_021112 [Ficus carica]